jgi:hypothetical protein
MQNRLLTFGPFLSSSQIFCVTRRPMLASLTQPIRRFTRWLMHQQVDLDHPPAFMVLAEGLVAAPVQPMIGRDTLQAMADTEAMEDMPTVDVAAAQTEAVMVGAVPVLPVAVVEAVGAVAAAGVSSSLSTPPTAAPLQKRSPPEQTPTARFSPARPTAPSSDSARSRTS